MANAVLKIECDGSVRGLWTDLINLTEIGVCHVQRASHVEFDHETQTWAVKLPNGQVIARDANRERAIQKEVEYLSALL